MKNVFKLVLVNIVVFLFLLFVMDMMAFAIMIVHQKYRNEKPKIDQRAFLPNYKDVDWATQYFKDKANSRTEYRSYIGWRSLAFQSKTVNIDSLGIRKTTNLKQINESTPLVVFLGGSTMWGAGVNDENTIPSLFSKYASTSINVVNFGESGYNAYQSYQFLQLRIMDGWRPDIIVSYDGVNDTPILYERKFAHGGEQHFIARFKASRPDSYKQFVFRSSFTLLEKVKVKFFPTRKKDLYTFSKEQNRAAAEVVLESWLQTKRLSQEIGAKFLCILQPNIFVGNSDITSLPANYRRPAFTHAYDYYDELIELLKLPKYQGLQSNFLDFRNALDRVPNVYIDYCHLSPKGNEIIAKRLLEKL